MESTSFITLEEEFKKNPELKESDLQSLKEWCRKQPHLPEVSDLDLVLFLHSNYYLMEPTKMTIDNFYTMRTHMPEFFTNRDVLKSKDLQKALNLSLYTPLNGTTNEGYKVIYSRLLDMDPSNFVHSESVKGYTMVLDMWLHIEGTAPGHVILIDMYGSVMGHVGRMNLATAKKSLSYLQDALPVRLKAIHVMNALPVMDIMLSMFKPFMKKELLDMLHIHTTTETLAKFIPLKMLPNEAGGKAGPLEKFCVDRMRVLKEHQDWFYKDEIHGRVNESLRSEKSKYASDIFGNEGSFKKLDID